MLESKRCRFRMTIVLIGVVTVAACGKVPATARSEGGAPVARFAAPDTSSTDTEPDTTVDTTTDGTPPVAPVDQPSTSTSSTVAASTTSRPSSSSSTAVTSPPSNPPAPTVPAQPQTTTSTRPLHPMSMDVLQQIYVSLNGGDQPMTRAQIEEQAGPGYYSDTSVEAWDLPWCSAQGATVKVGFDGTERAASVNAPTRCAQ